MFREMGHKGTEGCCRLALKLNILRNDMMEILPRICFHATVIDVELNCFLFPVSSSLQEHRPEMAAYAMDFPPRCHSGSHNIRLALR